MVSNPNASAGPERARAILERLRRAEMASGVATFELQLATGRWVWGPNITGLFGLTPDNPEPALTDFSPAIHADDAALVHAALAAVGESGRLAIEFRVKHPDGLRWLAGKGDVVDDEFGRRLSGAFYDITERKMLEGRLLVLNETLKDRIAEVREEAHVLEVLNQTGVAVAGELDLDRLVQTVTDAAVDLSGAAFGAFFYNLVREDGESYTLYTLSGAARAAFEKFPMPRNTAVFEPTFRGTGIVRSDDILADPRYGKNAPHFGMPQGHLPVRSYLAVPVMSRSGVVLGGLFFGHPRPGVFTERAERVVSGIAAQAAVAIDNAQLYRLSQREIAARQVAEQNLQALNDALEQRVAERARELATSVSKLEDSERRFQMLVEGVTDYAIYMLDPAGNIVNWNTGAKRIKGYAREDVVGRNFSMFYTAEDRAKDVPKAALETAMRTGQYQAEGWRVRKDGSTFLASVVINPIRDHSGTLLGFAKITRDMTEWRATQERLNQAQKMEAVGQLTGGVAHDFNNLLTVIIGNLESMKRHLRDGASDPARLERWAENALRGARRAESVTQRLLAFSRQQPLEPKPVDVSRLVTNMSDLLQRTIGEQIAVEAVLTGGPWRVHVDPNQLEVAILNLAVNARDAMGDGGKLTIETANVFLDERYAAAQVEVKPGQYVMLAVTDTGTGMTPAVIAKAFDPFFTTKDVGHGTGLGLSQVYGFVKQSGGHVKIYSEVGEGTSVKIYLPRYHSADAELQAEAVAPMPRGTPVETILVVEDDPDVRTYTCEILRELDYKVLEAASGAAAMQLLAARPEIRLLFTDVGLPGGMNGRQLSEAARRLRPDVKVLFTTGYARNAIVHDGRLDPGVALIVKPFSQGALADKLRDVLDADTGPSTILLVEDEMLVQMLASEYLADAGFKVEVAGSATEAMEKLGTIPGGARAVIVDMGLPDRRGDVLIGEIRAVHPALPVIVASGYARADLAKLFSGLGAIAFLNKPYSSEGLLAALRSVGVG